MTTDEPAPEPTAAATVGGEQEGSRRADEGGGEVGEKSFSFPFDAAAQVLRTALRQRDAVRKQPNFDIDDEEFLASADLDAEWVAASREVYAFKRRTHLAAVLCALLSRATDPHVDPASLQVGSGPYGYNASDLWRNTLLRLSHEKVSLNRLKDQPFNNSPYNGKKRISTDWDNVRSDNKAYLARTAALVETISAMTPEQAGRALTSFLTAAADPPPRTEVIHDGTLTLDVGLAVVADAIDTFITLNSDNGRRAQAFTTACLETAFPGRITTPESVNDPSRNSPGDVKSHPLGQPGAAGPLLVEVKDRCIGRTDVVRFIQEVAKHDASASIGYSALANDPESEMSMAAKDRIPAGENLTREFGIPVTVWRSPLDLLAWSATASLTPVPNFLAAVSLNYLNWLQHIDTGQHNSPQLWEKQLRDWGLLGGEPDGAATTDG